MRQQDGKPSLMARLAAAPICWGVEPADFVRRHADRIGHVHLEDVDASPAGYERWLVLEQDVATTGPEPAVESGPALDVRESIEFLSNRAPRREVSRT